jgi:hypothetical protein
MATSMSALIAGHGVPQASISTSLLSGARWMDFHSIVQYVLFLSVVTVMVKPLGEYMERVFSGKTTVLDWFFVFLSNG